MTSANLTQSAVPAAAITQRLTAGRMRARAGWLVALAGIAAMAAVPVAFAAGDPELISVDFVVGPTGGNGTGPCSGDTVLSGTTMNNAAGNIFTGQAGAWNPMNIGTYNQSSATSGFLTDGSGAVTGARMVMGLATGLNSTLAGGWRCSPNEGTANTIYQLRNESAYLYNGVITGDHFAWGFTGLTPNALYKMTLFGGSGNATGASNIANGVAGVRDSEGDWNWDSVTADSNGTIVGTFTAPNPTLGLFGAQLKHTPRTVPPQTAPGTPAPADGATNVTTSPTLSWSDCTGAEAYDVYLWTASGTQPATPTATVAVSHYSPPGFLVPSTLYRWLVIARNAAGTLSGPVWSFTSDDGRPAASANPTPAIAATGVLVDSVLDWGDSPGAGSYQIYIWLASDSKPATPTATLTTSSYLPAQALAGNSLYNWQIVAINSYGGTAGPVWTFTTGDRYPGYLVPWPKSVTMGSGDFTVTAATRIVAEDASLLPLAQVMARDILMAAGLNLTTLQGTATTGDIALRLNAALPAAATLTAGEAYTLEVNAANIILTGRTYQAAAWASVTLLQALDVSGTPAKVPQMLIADQPAAPLRTVMWDIARFFHPIENLYELVDLHRMYKVTYIHLFMSADGLFTFGTTAFPALAKTKTGSEAYAGSPGFYLPANGSKLYYTKAELTSLVQYAKDRGVVIVPEIDTPSWAAYMTSTLPATFCSSGGTTVTHDININYPTAVSAMDTLIGELAAVFSTSPYIHIGADEVPTSEFESYPNYATSKVTNNYASGGEGLVWYLHHLDATIKSYGKSSWAWSAPGAVGKGYDMPTDFSSATDRGLVYTGWGYDDGEGPSANGYSVMRAAGGHVAGMGQANRNPPYNRCLLYRPAQGIYNRLTPLLRFIGAPDNMYTDLTPTFISPTGHEDKIVGAHIMEWETPYEIEVPAMRLSMPALGEPTWNQETSTRRNWDNFMIRQSRTDQLYQKVMRPVSLGVTTQVDPKDVCFVSGGMVTMSSPVAGTIRYTVGTDYKNSWYNFPTSTSTAYTGPFAITQSSVISARLFDAAGNPLGNPVTRGFYLITPKTHYKYYLTGSAPAADFEKGTPLVSSVMGQMDGDAPHEDVRFGDSEHRTVYTGALNISTAGAYTFSASYGGTISIDRAAVTDGTAVTLAAGEHIFKIVTPASGLGTPYTFSGPGYSAGSDLNVLLKSLATASQVFPASHAFGTLTLSDGASAAKEITIVNHSLTANLTITSVGLTGANSGEFVISADSGETVLAPGAERVVAVRCNPATAGTKAATLHVVAAGLTGGAADVALSATAVVGSLPAIPATPVPASGASGVSVTPTLDWADAAGATGYDVYLWLATGSKPATPSASVTASQWTPPSSLTTGANYNWQVVATNANGSTAGPQWTFHVGTATVQVTNLTDGQELRYSLVLVDGTFDGGSTLTISAAPATAALSFTKYSNRFRCLVDLRPGTNTLSITDGHGTVTLGLVFTPPSATAHRFKVWYVVPSDEANSPVDADWLAHFSLQTKLMQSWMAEDQWRAGNGRLTFYPELDASSNVSVEKLVVTQTRAQATALGTGMYGEVWNQLPAVYKDGVHKNLAFSSVAFNALGSGDLCYVGAYGASGGPYAGFHPADATQMIAKLLSTQLGNDNALTYSTYTGVTLHEICHCLHSIWHDTSANNIMGGGGYDISQYFTLTYSTANTAPHNESSAGTLGNQRDLAAWNRYLMSADPHTYVNSTVTVNTGPEYLTASSPNPLAVFQYYIPNAAADLHVNLAATPVTSYSKHAGLARQELGASPFNVMAVDTEGNMSYGTFSGAVPVLPVNDSYAMGAGTTVIAAPGVLGNDINPSGSALSASVATNVQHGTLALNPDGGFSYTPTTNYVGTDTFIYKVSDGISSDQQATVTLTVTAAQLTQPTSPMPAAGATAVAVNTALDWADVAGATSYDVYLWPSAQAKPATPAANVAASNHVPAATLLGSTAYSWQVVAKNAGGSMAGAVWTFTTAAQTTDPANLISVDFVYSVTGSNPYTGDTILTGTLNNNAAGLMFTGQSGAWNAVNVGGNNANVSSASLSNLKNGAGTATTITFTMGTATSSGTSGGDWRNNYLTSFGNLRQEQPYLYNGVITGDHFDWEFSGLTPNAHYSLVVFGSGGGLSNVANGVAGSQDAEGDWNWADITATAAGRITGRFTDNTPTTTPGLYGLQLYKQAVSASLTADAGPDQSSIPVQIGGSTATASGGTAPYAYSWSPITGLTDATAANPVASPATTTTYTVTVTDFLGATASDSVTVTVNGAPAPTTTTLTSSPNASGAYGTAVTFTASVSPQAGGTVTFSDGAVLLGSGTLAAGVATLTTGSLAMGGHAITATYTGSATFEPSTSTVLSYAVTAKALTLSDAAASDKTYDGTTTATLTGSTLAGVVGSESVTVASLTGNFADANAGSNKPVTATAYALGGAQKDNYTLTLPSGLTASILPRPVVLTGTRAYDGTPSAAAGILSVSNKISGDNLSVTGSATLSGKDVGTRSIATGTAVTRVQTATGSTGASASGSFTVTLGSQPADGNTLVAVITTRGTSSGRVSGISGGGVTWSRVSQSQGTAGTTTEIWHGPNISNGTTAITITQASLLSAAVVIEYAGLLVPAPADAAGNSSGSSTSASTGTTTGTAQAYELCVGGIGLVSSSYTLTNPTNGFATVASARSSNSTASNNSVAYALEKIVTATGTPGSGGTVSTSSQWSGAVATFKAAQAAVPTSAPVRVQAVSAIQNSSSGSTYNVTIATPAAGNSLIAVINTRNAGGLQGTGGVASTGANWSRVGSQAVGSNCVTEIWVAPGVSAGASGTVTLTESGTGRSAAVVMEYSGVLTTNPLDQTATTTGSSANPVTGTVTPTETNELWIGAIGCQGGSSTGNTLSNPANSFALVSRAFTTSATAANNANIFALEYVANTAGAASSGGTITSAQWAGAIAAFKAAPATIPSLALGDSAAPNYTLGGATGSVLVTKKALTLGGLSASNKNYDGGTAAVLTGTAALAAAEAGPGTSSDGKPYIGDDLNLTGSTTGAFANRHAGNLKPVTVSGPVLGGAQAGNYTLVMPADLTANIMPRPLTVAAVDASKTYDGTTTASGTPTLTPPLVSGDTAGVLNQSYQDPGAGTGNKVIVPNILIDDGNGGANYALTLTNFTAGTIDRAAATVTLGNLSHTYDGTPKAATATTDPAGLAVDLTYDGAPDPPSAAGSHNVVAVISNPNYTGTASGTLVISMESIAEWRTCHFMPDEIAAGLAADGVDPDGDGLTNEQEYVLGSDPKVSNPQPLLIAPGTGNNFVLSFLALRATGVGYVGLTRKYAVECTTDPGLPDSWTALAGYAGITGNDQAVTITLAADAPKKFYRLNVRVE